MQCRGRNCGSPCALNLRGSFVDNLDIQIRCPETGCAAFSFDQNIRKNWDRIAALDHRLGLANGFQQDGALNTDFHDLTPLRRVDGEVTLSVQ